MKRVGFRGLQQFQSDSQQFQNSGFSATGRFGQCMDANNPNV
ncbi:Unknown protein sequence [Pseudomonas syringae pv. maculicola]|nr:Unknown protein sequence [Pseudomonas syringae pv. maculicola]